MKTIEVLPPKYTVNADIKPASGPSAVSVDSQEVVYSPIDSSLVHNQNLKASITENGRYEYTFDRTQYTGLDNVAIDVSVNTVYNQKKQIVITENGVTSFTPDQGYTGLYKIDVSTNVYVPPIQPSQVINISSNGEYDVFPDEGYDGIGELEVNVSVPPTPTQTKQVTYKYNGQYEVYPDGGKNLSRVDVSVNIDTGAFYNSGFESGHISGMEDQKALLEQAHFTDNGTFIRSNGWNRVTVSVPVDDYYRNGYNDGSTQGYITGFTDGSTAGYNLGYEDGSVEGYILGNSVGYNNGYNDGENAGFNAGYNQGYPAGIAAQKNLLDSSIFTENGTYTFENGWNEITVDVSTGHGPISLQSKTVSPSTSQMTIYPDASYDGLSDVVVSGVTSAIDSNIIETNIRQGVSILGVLGTLVPGSGANLMNLTVDSSIQLVQYTAPTGFDGFSTVTVNPYVLDTKIVNSSTTTQTVISDRDGLEAVVVNPYTTQTKTVNVDSSVMTITPDANRDALASVQINVTANVDEHIVPGNIAEGITILGVTGTLSSGSGSDNLGFEEIYNRLSII